MARADNARKRACWLLIGALALFALLFPQPADAAQVTVLTDSRVAQYRAALGAAKEVIPQAAVLELAETDLDEKLGQVGSSQGVVLAIGQKAMARAQQAGVAVVFCMVLGPAAASGKTITGLRLEVAAETQLEQFKRIHPMAKRIGVLYNEKTWGSYLADATRSGSALGIQLVGKSVADAREIPGAIRELSPNIDALWLLPDPQLISVEVFNLLLVYTLERKIALFGFFEAFTRAGALASITPDYAAIGRQAAKLTAELAQKPPEARLPFPPMVASPGALSINVKTAAELGIDVSDDVLRQATQVFR